MDKHPGSATLDFTCFLQCSSYNTPLYDLPIDAAINQDLMDTGKEIHRTGKLSFLPFLYMGRGTVLHCWGILIWIQSEYRPVHFFYQKFQKTYI